MMYKEFDMSKANEWQGFYFSSKNRVVAQALAKLAADRKTYESVKESGHENASLLWYVASLVEAMSAVFGAIGSLWQFWRIPKILFLISKLRDLCNEYDEVRFDPHLFDHDEVYVACLLRLGFITRLYMPQEFGYERCAKQIVEDILDEVSSGRHISSATLFLLKARHSCNPLVGKAYRKRLSSEVSNFLDRLVYTQPYASEMEEIIGQGYKTICCLGWMVGNYRACRIALRYDQSKDMRRKTFVLLGYWKYMLLYKLDLVK